jgi:hypothetical protein
MRSQRWFAINILYVKLAVVYVPILILRTIYKIALIRRYCAVVRDLDVVDTVALASLICLLTLFLFPSDCEKPEGQYVLYFFD